MSPDERAVFKFDESVLSPVHWRAIERLYADQVWEVAREQHTRVCPSACDAVHSVRTSVANAC